MGGVDPQAHRAFNEKAWLAVAFGFEVEEAGPAHGLPLCGNGSPSKENWAWITTGIGRHSDRDVLGNILGLHGDDACVANSEVLSSLCQ